MSKPIHEPKIVVSKNGPYLVTGGIPLTRQTILSDAAGDSEKWQESETFPAKPSYALCRCGHSASKPFCDGTHKKIGFDGTESASREPYRRQAKAFEGPSYTLTDVEAFCAGADFCQANNTVWKQVAGTQDPAVRDALLPEIDGPVEPIASPRSSAAASLPPSRRSRDRSASPSTRVSGRVVPCGCAVGFR